MNNINAYRVFQQKATTLVLNKKRTTSHFVTSDILLERERKAIYDSEFYYFSSIWSPSTEIINLHLFQN